MPPVRNDTDTRAVPLSGVDWLMVTMEAPAPEMASSRLCSAPVSSRSVACTVVTSALSCASYTQSLYL